MAHFAELDENETVIRVIVVHNNESPSEDVGVAFLNSLYGGGRWIQTSYHGNIRKNFAGIGDQYDKNMDAFVSPQPFKSWALNSKTCRWEPPVPMPDDGNQYQWDEQAVAWVESK